jgi:hypothetical protein
MPLIVFEALMPDFEAMAQDWVKRTIRAEMVKRGITYGDLVHLLAMGGADENERNLRNKVARGTFSAVLFAQCLAAMGCKTLTIDLLDQMYAGSDEVETRPSASVIVPIIKAVKNAIQNDTPADKEPPSLAEVYKAVQGTDLKPFTSGSITLDEVVRSIRKHLDS